MAAEKQITPGTTVGSMQVIATNPTDADIAAFHAGDEQRQLDLAEFMQGTTHALGGQHDMNPRGLTTDTGQWQQPPDTTQQFPLIAPQPTFVPSPQAPELSQAPASEQDFRRLYGQSENEKGALRQSVQELQTALQQQLSANSQLMQQMQQFMLQPQSSPAPYSNSYDQSGYAPVGPGYSYAPPQISSQPQQYQQPQLPTRFVSKPDGEMVFSEDLEGVLQGRIAPAYQTVYADAQRALGETQQLRAMLVAQEKERRGITPQVEVQALMERPWVRNLQHNPQAYIAALADYAAAKQATSLLQRPGAPSLPQSGAPAATLPATAAAAARRITYVENAPAMSANDGAPAANAFQQEMATAMQEPHPAKRAVAMRAVFAKYKINQASDWRDPSVSTR